MAGFRQLIEERSAGEATLNEEYLIETLPDFSSVVASGQAAVEPLTAALDDVDEFVRKGAAVALERIGVAVPIAAGPLTGEREETRRAIRGGLDEPYCSERCYELGGETIAREQISPVGRELLRVPADRCSSGSIRARAWSASGPANSCTSAAHPPAKRP